MKLKIVEACLCSKVPDLESLPALTLCKAHLMMALQLSSRVLASGWLQVASSKSTLISQHVDATGFASPGYLGCDTATNHLPAKSSILDVCKSFHGSCPRVVYSCVFFIVFHQLWFPFIVYSVFIFNPSMWFPFSNPCPTRMLPPGVTPRPPTISVVPKEPTRLPPLADKGGAAAGQKKCCFFLNKMTVISTE